MPEVVSDTHGLPVCASTSSGRASRSVEEVEARATVCLAKLAAAGVATEVQSSKPAATTCTSQASTAPGAEAGPSGERRASVPKEAGTAAMRRSATPPTTVASPTDAATSSSTAAPARFATARRWGAAAPAAPAARAAPAAPAAPAANAAPAVGSVRTRALSWEGRSPARAPAARISAPKPPPPMPPPATMPPPPMMPPLTRTMPLPGVLPGEGFGFGFGFGFRLGLGPNPYPHPHPYSHPHPHPHLSPLTWGPLRRGEPAGGRRLSRGCGNLAYLAVELADLELELAAARAARRDHEVARAIASRRAPPR